MPRTVILVGQVILHPLHCLSYSPLDERIPQEAFAMSANHHPPLNHPLSTDDPQGDLRMLGIDPAIPYFALNLAGSDLPLPRPASLAAQGTRGEDPPAGNAPTFGAPDFDVPSLKPYDLTGPGIDALAPLQPDPQTGDLLQFARPLGLDIYAASDTPMQFDPFAPDLDDHDRPAGLAMPGPLMIDPALPDLQSPTLTQQIEMPARPADLAPGALATMHGGETYRQLDDEPYRQVYMDATGVNSTRRRHMDLLMRGLDDEER
ncbi:MAG TPA: hypothetical protein VKT25_11290 [Ktedonobacteraceae bacterium]|nr:hypothetical protein [Ktedonobacteraceae bacterium]